MKFYVEDIFVGLSVVPLLLILLLTYAFKNERFNKILIILALVGYISLVVCLWILNRKRDKKIKSWKDEL
jgi:uncharacterized membrane protein YqjE